MKGTPNFEVGIIKGRKTLSFTCSFLKGYAEEEEYDDVFGIDEVTMYEGEWTDGYFYDLLLNLLDEKGITNEFAGKLRDFSTNYEHATYVGFLETLSKFTLSGK